METPVHTLEGLFEKVELYSKTSFELSKLKALETTTMVASTVLSRLTIIVVFSMFMLFFNIGIALFVGELLGRSYYGFLIVSGAYLLAGIILHFFLYKWIRKPLSDFIITQVLQ